MEHGFFEGCPQRDHNVVHGRSKDGVSHIAECCARLLDRLLATPRGRARLESCEVRVVRAISDMAKPTTTRHDATAAIHSLEPRSDGHDDGA